MSVFKLGVCETCSYNIVNENTKKLNLNWVEIKKLQFFFIHVYRETVALIGVRYAAECSGTPNPRILYVEFIL